MALRFCDSFDHYTAPSNKYTAGGLGGTISAGNGRNGTAAWLNGSNQNQTIGKVLDSQATWIIGVAIKSAGFGNGSNQQLVAFYDVGTLHCDVRLTSAGKLTFTRAGTVLATSDITLVTNVYYFLEVKVTISDTGSFTVRVDQTVDANMNGVSADTRNAANASADRILLGSATGNQNTFGEFFDDFYVCDSSGSVNNDFLGDVRVQYIAPSGNGNSSVFVGSDGNSTDNYLLVDEAAPNSDTDYVQGSSVGDKDTYAFGNVTPTAGTIAGVQVLPWASKTDAGSRSIASVARVSTNEEDSANKVLSTSYQYLPDIRETKPGGGAWSISDVNSAEFGVKVTV